MTVRSPSSGLDAIIGIMESEIEENGTGHVFDTLHFISTKLRGNFDLHEDLSRSIGLKEREKKFDLKHPFINTKRLMLKITPQAQLGIALGQAIAGMPVNIYQGIPTEMEELIGSYKPMTIFCFDPCRKDFNIDRFRRSDAVLIGISDISKEPPVYIPEIRKGKDLVRLSELIGELTDAPRIYNMNCSDAKKDLDFILISDIDSILIDCTPDPLEKRTDIMMLTSLVRANRQVDLFKRREKDFKIIINGPVRNIADILKTMALGADIIGIDHLTLSFLRSYLSFKTGEKFVTNEDLSEPNESLDWAEIGELYSEFIEILVEKLIESLLQLNIDPEKGISITDIDTSDYNTASISGLSLEGFGKPVPFWRHRS
jgi:hypothetical protein